MFIYIPIQNTSINKIFLLFVLQKSFHYKIQSFILLCTFLTPLILNVLQRLSLLKFTYVNEEEMIFFKIKKVSLSKPFIFCLFR